MRMLFRLFAWLGVGVLAGAASPFPSYPLDSGLLGIQTWSDPNYPVPERGSRKLYVRLAPDPSWGEWELDVVVTRLLSVAQEASDVLVDPPGPGARKLVLRVFTRLFSTGPDIHEGEVVIPHRRPGVGGSIRAEGASWFDYLEDWKPAYYKYVVRHRAGPADPWTRVEGDVHALTAPPRVTVGVAGDSFGSGEGAPAGPPYPWVKEIWGHEARRSPHSGQNAAMERYAVVNPGIAFDAINVTSSGAIAHDLYHPRMSQYGRPDTNPNSTTKRGLLAPQFAWLRHEMADRGYPELDLLVLSVGGNDVGFAKVVKQYFGIDEMQLVPAALCILSTGGPVGAPLNPLFYLCASIVQATVLSLPEHSIRAPYDAGFVSGYQWRTFSWHQQRLAGEIRTLAAAVASGSGGGSVLARRVAATEYPNPLQDCVVHEDSFEVLRLLLNGDLPFPFSLRVRVSQAEALEINTQLAPPLSDPWPRGGGLNHGLRDAIQAVDGAYGGIPWDLIRTRDHQYVGSGLEYASRGFVRLSDAQFIPAPPRESLPVHPNRRGHAQIYYPAIRDYVLGRLDKAYRLTGLERLRPPSLPEPDLAFSGTLEVTSWDGATRQLGVSLPVRNWGGSSAAATVVRIGLGDPVGPVGTLAVPALAPNELVMVQGTVTVPEHPIFGYHRFVCRDVAWPAPGFEAFATRDAVLAWHFPLRWTVQATLDPEDQVAESNEANNTEAVERLVEIGPAVDPSTLQAVLNDLEAAAGPVRPLERSDLERSDVLAFFGYYDFAVRWLMEAAAPDPRDVEVFLNQLNRPARLRAGLPDPENSRFQIRDGLRPICLWSEDERAVLATDKTVREPRRLVDHADFEQVRSRDGRPTVLRVTLAGREFERAVEGPQIHAGFPGWVDDAPLAGAVLEVQPSVPGGVERVRILAGTVAGGDDVFDSGELGAEEAASPRTVAGLPQDGRPVFFTVRSLIGGEWSSEHYRRLTPEWNARLVEPADADGVAPATWFRWREGQAAEGYGLRVGSAPGAWDLFPGTAVSPEEGGRFSAGVLEHEVAGLPRDGRWVYVTLETRRGGAWHEESYRFRCREAEDAALVSPWPGQAQRGRIEFFLAPGVGEVTGHRLLVGRGEGESDLFDSGLLPATGLGPVPVTLPQADQPYFYVSVVTERSGGETRRGSYQFIWMVGDAVLEPARGTVLPAGPVTFTLLGSPEPVDRLLRFYAGGSGDVAHEEWIEGAAASAVVDVARWAGQNLVVELRSPPDAAEPQDFALYAVENPGGYDYGADRLPVWWQRLFFGLANPQAAPEVDADGDWDDNWKEYLAGTDPTDAKDRLRLGGRWWGTEWRLELPRVRAGTGYQVWASEDLRQWAPSGGEWQPGADATNAVWGVPVDPLWRARFFRLELRDRP